MLRDSDIFCTDHASSNEGYYITTMLQNKQPVGDVYYAYINNAETIKQPIDQCKSNSNSPSPPSYENIINS